MASDFSPKDMRALRSGIIVPDQEQAEQLRAFWRQLGMRPSAAPAAADAGSHHVRYQFLLNEQVRAKELATCWIEILRRNRPASLADLILIEYWFSVGAAKVAKFLSPGLTYSKTLLTIRQRVAISLHDYAREINWRRPVLFVSALKIARAYLRDTVGHQEAVRADLRKNFTGRLGVATILISRFESVSSDDAREAVLAIERSIEQGNTDDSAFAYLLEAYCVLYDVEPSLAILDRALGRAADNLQKAPDSGLILASVDLLLRKATADGFEAPDKGVLSEAATLARRCAPSSAEDKVRLIMADAIIEFLGSGDIGHLQLEHARLPFGLRFDGEANELLIRSAPFVLDPLRRMAQSGEPLARGLLADYLLSAAAELGLSGEDALAEVISLRGGERSLEDGRSRLLQCRDRLRLAAVTGNKDLRVDTLLELAGMIEEEQLTAAAIVLLARDVRDHGAQPLPIEVGTGAAVEEVIRQVSRGEVEALYERAGRVALGSSDLSILALGGRSGVTSVADYYGLSSETFVFKSMTPNAYEQERERAERLLGYLRVRELNDSYDVARMLATYVENSDVAHALTTARHYIRGRSLFASVSEAGPEERRGLLKNAAYFLGLINDCESGPPARDGRRELKEKEVGRWLKSCGLADSAEIFDSWWVLVRDANKERRRDAHLHNWLVSADGKLYAIDLEAQGWRPVGYELAQLTDDHDFLPVEDWQSRREIFDSYQEARVGTAGDLEVEWLAYQAGVLARLLWSLTSPNDSPVPPGVAESRLHSFAESITDSRLKSLSERILVGWLSTRGLNRLPPGDAATRGAGRVRTSKSMAFHLRHDSTLQRDEGGWVLLEDLQEKLSPRLSVEVLAAVATDRRERRFEIESGRIRAKYGHSIPAKLDYGPPREFPRLYHASPWASAGLIFDRGLGVRPMGRQFVHLTDSVAEAVANGMRAGQPLLYSVAASRVDGLLLAHGRTYLSGPIPVASLSIVPVSCFWTQVPPCM